MKYVCDFWEKLSTTLIPKLVLDKSEGKIFWEESAKEILGKINGLYPSPGAWFIFKNERYKILKAEFSSAKGKPGLILNNNLEIACNDFSIKILKIQREGRKIQNINQFILGSEIKKGTDLNNALIPSFNWIRRN